jgi:hypothetical protein
MKIRAATMDVEEREPIEGGRGRGSRLREKWELKP